MIYSGRTIARKMKRGELVTGSHKRYVNPASLNLRLGRSFKTIQRGQTITLGQSVKYTDIYVEKGQAITIYPGEFMLATTMECVNIPTNVMALVVGRSSIARVGLSVEIAGDIDPGFTGHITLELYNESACPIRLVPGYEICQMIVLQCDQECEAYNGKYNGQVMATESRMERDRAVRVEPTEEAERHV